MRNLRIMFNDLKATLKLVSPLVIACLVLVIVALVFVIVIGSAVLAAQVLVGTAGVFAVLSLRE